MRLDKVMTELLLKIDPSYEVYLEQNGTVVVELDKALYGCGMKSSKEPSRGMDLRRTLMIAAFLTRFAAMDHR